MALVAYSIKYRLKAFLLKLLYFKTEQKLLKGQFKGAIDKPPVILLTVHKAASSLLSIRLAPFFQRHGYAVADISSYFAKTGLHQRPDFLKSEQQKRNVFCTPGIFHCAIRWEVNIPCIDKVKIILVLRDPRDVLVSHYYSTLYSHPEINPEFFALKEMAKKTAIDDYARFMAQEFQKRYAHYVHMIRSNDVLFLRYEDLITNPREFEQRVGKFAGVEVGAGEIVSENDFKVEKENPGAHKRQVKAGDHKSKLQPETIKWLSDYFRDELIALHYEI